MRPCVERVGDAAVDLLTALDGDTEMGPATEHVGDVGLQQHDHERAGEIRQPDHADAVVDAPVHHFHVGEAGVERGARVDVADR